LIFTIFDRSALGRVVDREKQGQAQYYARFTDVANPGEYSATRGSTIPRENSSLLATGPGVTRDEGAILEAGNPESLFTNDIRTVNYVDQIPPFDIVLSAQNEMGHRMFLQLFGVELLNQGSGVSVDDIVIEAQMTFVCRSMIDWKQIGRITQEGPG
jgi:hypothetical protein